MIFVIYSPSIITNLFYLLKNGDSKDFVFFKYSTDNGKIDKVDEKEDLEFKNHSLIPLL
jgi:hypothetical protein